MAKKILVLIAGENFSKHKAFEEEAEKLGVSLQLSSLNEVNYITDKGEIAVRVGDKNLSEFKTVYIRLAGKRKEDVANILKGIEDSRVKIVDSLYESAHSLVIPLPKSVETQMLARKGVPVPKTFFGSLKKIGQEAPNIFGFPFVLKSTRGKRGRDIWLPNSQEELKEAIKKASQVEKSGSRFLAQQLIKTSHRIRVLVVGDEVLGAITRSTKWGKRFTEKELDKAVLEPVPDEVVRISVEASRALALDIAGVDILQDDKTGDLYVIEVNQAPRWVSFKKDTGINVERKIIEFLSS